MEEYGRPQPKPVAKAEIRLTEDDRRRIAKELRLDADQLELIPEKLDIARYDNEAIGGDLPGFLSGLAGESVSLEDRPFGVIGGPNLQVATVPDGILIPV